MRTGILSVYSVIRPPQIVVKPSETAIKPPSTTTKPPENFSTQPILSLKSKFSSATSHLQCCSSQKSRPTRGRHRQSNPGQRVVAITNQMLRTEFISLRTVYSPILWGCWSPMACYLYAPLHFHHLKVQLFRDLQKHNHQDSTFTHLRKASQTGLT